MRRNAAKVLRPTRLQARPAPAAKAGLAARAARAAAPKEEQPLTVGDLIAAAYDVVGDDAQKVADVLSTTELRRRVRRQIFFI